MFNITPVQKSETFRKKHKTTTGQWSLKCLKIKESYSRCILA